MRLIDLLKVLNRDEYYALGKMTWIRVLISLFFLGVFFIYYANSDIDYTSEVSIKMELLDIEELKNEAGIITGYRLFLHDSEKDKKIEYPVIGNITPIPKKGNQLPFSRLNVTEGKHQYIFDKPAWKTNAFNY